MATLTMEVPLKRAAGATPERLLAMRRGGMKMREIAAAAGISPGRVYQLIIRAKKNEIPRPPQDWVMVPL